MFLFLIHLEQQQKDKLRLISSGSDLLFIFLGRREQLLEPFLLEFFAAHHDEEGPISQLGQHQLQAPAQARGSTSTSTSSHHALVRGARDLQA